MPRYEDDLREKLGKTRAPITVGQYIKRLQTLNDNKHLTSMRFLMDYDAMIDKIDKMELAFTTKTSYLTAICATLGQYPKYHKLYKRYQTLMIKNANEIRSETQKNIRNEKQKESIIPMAEIIETRDFIRKQFDDGITEKGMNSECWEYLLSYFLICLYTEQPVRRNKDFAECFVVFEEPETLDDKKNYYVASTGEFIYNNYKTSSFKGQQRFTVNEKLKKIIDEYLFFYINHIDVQTPAEFPLLVHYDNRRIHPVNGITRTLNKAFQRNIGSSALRHIYITEKFGETFKEMEETANAMAHSTKMQKEYSKHHG